MTALNVPPCATSLRLFNTLNELNIGMFFFFNCAVYPLFDIDISLTALEPTAISPKSTSRWSMVSTSAIDVVVISKKLISAETSE